MKKRSIALLLCLVLLLALLPTAALAEGLTIKTVTMSVPTPEEYSHPDAYPTVYFGAGNGLCDVLTCFWFDMSDGGALMYDDDQFMGGHVYRMSLTLVAGGENVFGGAHPGMVTVNNTEIPNKDITVSADGKKLTVEYTFPKLESVPVEPIEKVFINVTKPKVGDAPDMPITTTPFTTVADYSWDPDDAAFQEGYTYRLTVTVERSNIYNRFTAKTTATINGINAVITNYGLESITFYVDFYVDETPKTVIDSVSVSVNAPKDWEMPQFTATLGGASYALEQDNGGSYKGGVCWLDETVDPSLTDDQRILKNGGAFYDGHSYRVIVELVAADGYKFADDLSATVNGQTAEAYQQGKVLRVSYLFPAVQTPKTPVGSVAVTVTEPTAGEGPIYKSEAGSGHYNVHSTWDAERTSQGLGWALMKGDTVYDIDHTMDFNETFAVGKRYMVAVALEPQSGYAFADDLTTDMSKVLVNGQPATAATRVGSQLIVYYIFPQTTEVNYINTVALTVPERVVGEYPAYTATIAADAHYRVYTEQSMVPMMISGMAWMEADQMQDMVDDYPTMKPTDVFQAGKYHAVYFLLIAEDGYVFSKSLSNENSGISVNGATYYFATSDEFGKNVLLVMAVLPPMPAPKTLSSIAVTTPPTKTQYTAGQAFDPAGMVVTATYSDKTTAAVTGYTVTPTALTQNDSYVTVSYTEGEVTKTATTPVTVKPAKTLTAIAVTKAPNTTAYTAGEAFDPTGMVVTATYSDQTTDTVAGYSVTPKLLTLGDTAVTVSYTEGSVTKTATVAVTVKANEKKNPFKDILETDYYYDAVLWAYYAEPQVTNGMSADEFGPKNTVTRGQAVTFLWRAMGRPEPTSKTNPFVDVAETEYYYKAVLWAVEKGITNGTDATHFTPNQTCSTAHILTFLYRTLGIGSNGWYEVAGAWAKGAGLLNGLTTAVSPEVNCPRADVVLFLYRAVGK